MPKQSNPEDAARAFLEGLKGRSAPWDQPSEKPAPSKPAAPAASSAPKSGPDDAMDQADKIRQRNEDFAKRTRHLRQS